jgi:type I restriction enzyme S subunit
MSYSRFERYEAYKNSGVEWFKEVPAHWNMNRLKEISNIQNSNVDKKSNENETPVQLCNYVDVYKNDFIKASIDFMWATANKSEIKRFTVNKDDVLITKDSETCDDIAIPALATEFLDGVLCGYHLAQLRTKDKVLLGTYLFRLFQSKNYGFRFVIYAKGITRFGLGQSAIADSLTPVPPITEQQAIAVYLDTNTEKIDRKIDLLSQKATQYGKLKQSLINETVTQGLDKTIPMKDSGIQWIGKVPVHWEVTAITNITIPVSIKNHPNEELLSVYRDYGVIIKSTREDNHNKAGANLSSYKLVEPGYLVINKMKAWQGSLGISEFRGIVSPAYITCKTNRTIIERGYLHHLLRCRNYINEYNRLSYGVRVDQWDMRYDDFKYVPVLLPPLDEQKAIANYLDEKTAHIDRIVTTINTQIEKLKELRKTLINDVVTGKIRVVKEGHAA